MTPAEHRWLRIHKANQKVLDLLKKAESEGVHTQIHESIVASVAQHWASHGWTVSIESLSSDEDSPWRLLVMKP